MLRSIIICPDQELSSQLEEALAAVGEATVYRTLSQYPSVPDLVRTLRAHAPDLIFLSFEGVEQAEAVIKFLETEAEDAQIIGIHRAVDPAVLRTMMRQGVREFVGFPFDHRSLAESLRHCAALLERTPNPNLDDVKRAVSGNLCRCGTYPKVFAATLDVAQQRRQTAGLVTLVAGREA